MAYRTDDDDLKIVQEELSVINKAYKKRASKQRRVDRHEEIKKRALKKLAKMPDLMMLPVNQCAVILEVHRCTVWAYVRRGDLKLQRVSERCPRIKVGDLRDFLDREIK